MIQCEVLDDISDGTVEIFPVLFWVLRFLFYFVLDFKELISQDGGISVAVVGTDEFLLLFVMISRCFAFGCRMGSLTALDSRLIVIRTGKWSLPPFFCVHSD